MGCNHLIPRENCIECGLELAGRISVPNALMAELAKLQDENAALKLIAEKSNKLVSRYREALEEIVNDKRTMVVCYRGHTEIARKALLDGEK